MYNRYVPGSDGVYERRTVPEPCQPASTPAPLPVCAEKENTQQPPHISQNKVFGLDLGDLLLLCVLILLWVDSADEEEFVPLLIMLAAFLIQQ